MDKAVSWYTRPRAHDLTAEKLAVSLLVGLFVALQFVLQGAVSLMVPEIKADMGLNEAGIGLLSSLFFYPYVCLQIPAGRLVSLIGPRLLLVCAGLLMASGCLVQGLASESWQLMLGRTVLGIGAAPIIVCFLKTAERSFAPALFGLMAAAMEVVGMVGAALGDFLIPASVRDWGWQPTLMLFAVVAAVLTVAALWMLPRSLAERTTQPQDEGGAWHGIIINCNVWLGALYSGLLFAVINAFAALWSIPFLESTPLCQGVSGVMTGLVFIGVAVAAPLLGWKADHGLDMRRAMVLASVLTVALLLLLLSGWLSATLYYPVMFLLGLCASVYMLPFVLVKHWFCGEQLSIALAMTNAISVMVGALLYQPLIGWLVGFHVDPGYDHYRQVLLIIPAGVALAGLLTLLIRKPMG